MGSVANGLSALMNSIASLRNGSRTCRAGPARIPKGHVTSAPEPAERAHDVSAAAERGETLRAREVTLHCTSAQPMDRLGSLRARLRSAMLSGTRGEAPFGSVRMVCLRW